MQVPKPGAVDAPAAACEPRIKDAPARQAVVSQFNQFLSQMAALPAHLDLFSAAARELVELIDACFVAINLYHAEQNVLICCALATSHDLDDHLHQLLGQQPVGFSAPVMSGEMRQGILSGRMTQLRGGIHELTVGALPRDTCQQLEQLLGIGRCYAVGMAWQGAMVGTIAFATPVGTAVNADLAEACARQIAVLHRQRETERTLAETNAQLEERVCQRTMQLERSNQAMLSDIQERKQLEAALRTSQANLQAIFENVEDSIWSVDRDYRLLIGNSVFLRNTSTAFGRPVMPGESVLDRSVSSDAYAKWKGYYDRALAGERFMVEEPSQLLSSRMMEYCFGPIRTEDGKVVGVIAINRDVTEQWQTREALHKSEEKYRRLFDNAQVGMFRTRLDGSEVLEINDRLAQMLEKTKSDVVGTWSLSHWGDPRKRGVLLQMLKESTSVAAFEMPALAGDGSVHTFLLSVTAYPQENLLEGTAVDITERKRMEEALRESERRMADLLHNLPGMAYRCSNDEFWTMEFLSEGVEALTGYAADEIVANRRVSYADLIVPEDRALVWDAVQAGMAENRSYQMVYRIRTASGEQRWVWEQGAAVHAGADAPQMLEGFISDITPLRMAQEAIRQSEERFRTLFEVSGIGTAIVGTDGRILRANSALGKFLECEPERLVGRTFLDVTYPGDYDADARPIAMLLANEIPSYSLEKRYVTATGRVVWGLLTASLVQDSGGAPLFLIGQVQDIDERRGVQAKLEQLYRQTRHDAQEKSILLNEANHRVKNNLMAILGLLLAEQQFARPEQRALLESYFENVARRIRGLIEVHRLLSESEWVPLQLSELISHVIHTELNALSLGERVQVMIAPSAVQVSSRQASNLAIVVNELLSNSLKHALDAVIVLQVSITAAMVDDCIQVVYRDNGSGYPASVLSGEQHGVGLYLLRRIVERTLRGSLSFANDDGAVTEIVIPLDNIRSGITGQNI